MGTYGLATTFAAARAVSVLGGPDGLAINGTWVVSSIVSPAYRVTILCMIQLVIMRRNYLALARLQSAAS